MLYSALAHRSWRPASSLESVEKPAGEPYVVVRERHPSKGELAEEHAIERGELVGGVVQQREDEGIQRGRAFVG